MAKISVLGAGSWGTALSLLLHNNGHEVILWSVIEEEVKMLREKRQRRRLISQQIWSIPARTEIFWFWRFPRLTPEVLRTA